MANFIQLNHVVANFNHSQLTRNNEKAELISINVEAIEYVGAAKKSEGLITIARGYVRTKNCDFRVAESYEEIMRLIARSSENADPL